MSVQEYSLKFTQLSHYAPEMVANMRSRMSLFMSGLSRLSNKEGKADMLIRDMDIDRLMIHRSSGPAQSSASAPTPRNKNDCRNKSSQNFIGPIQESVVMALMAVTSVVRWVIS
ncbi:hypothetical protein H5410_036585 [Solanum commersonii]|uniref:Gag-pol polyprotein n=1 Tax=Solanum commersonii TaxID=4109 RepID=A0A9J5Y4P4_SOLCO|nr:hypothetical protein H5410_036585 [Solanum commersonii]